MTEVQSGSGFAAGCIEEVLDSASNAASVGPGQFWTPPEFARMVAIPLVPFRPVMMDLTSGNGQLLLGAHNASTETMLGIDLDPAHTARNKQGLSVSKLTGDLTKVYPLMSDVRFHADLFVLNPPYGLRWSKERLLSLAQSEMITVAQAFVNGKDPSMPEDEIDSTIATFLMAIDLLSIRGEGLLICNHATMDRLVFTIDAPFRQVAKHAWARITLDGNPMTGDKGSRFEENMKTAVIYFARSHLMGIRVEHHAANLESFDACANEVLKFRQNRWSKQGEGVTESSGDRCHQTVGLFKAVRDEYAVRYGTKKPEFNIWLEDGVIKTYLSVFQDSSRKVDKEAVKRLHSLKDKNPMQLVVQMATRKQLDKAVNGKMWRVHPDLPAAVAEAIRQYDAIRAPLAPLSETQRIGFVDQEKVIECRKDLHLEGRKLFTRGKEYEINTRTVMTDRKRWKPSISGELQEMLMSGQELVILLKADDGKNYLFIDQRHMKDGVKVTSTTASSDDPAAVLTSDFPLQALADNFIIPEVPEVSVCSPQLYGEYFSKMENLELLMQKWCPGFKFKNFQNCDYASLATQDGGILAHRQGLGKGIAAFAWPLIKVGWNPDVEKGLVPLEPVLILAPAGLHDQLKREARRKFGATITDLDSHATYWKLKPIKPGWYITNYQAMSSNGVKELPKVPDYQNESADWDVVAGLMKIYGVSMDQVQAHTVDDIDGGGTLLNKANHLCQLEYDKFSEGIGEEKDGIMCCYSPRLVDLCSEDFSVVVVDEAIRMKAQDSLIGAGSRRLNPKYRVALTGTPVKNRLPDIFWLAWWAAGGKPDAHARWPYRGDGASAREFSQEFLQMERNLSVEREKNHGKIKRAKNGKRVKGKLSSTVCNIHRIWKLLAPVVLRRTEHDIGEEMVSMTKHTVRVPMGTHQSRVYGYHLAAEYTDKNGMNAQCAKLTALRMITAAPHAATLQSKNPNDGPMVYRSQFEFTPKMSTVMNLIATIIESGEQVVISSAFHEPLDVLARRLELAGIPFELLDGRSSPAERGKRAEAFQEGRPFAAPVLLGGLKAIAEGYSFDKCCNAILFDFDWAMDLILQFFKRVHRLNSKKPVKIYAVVAEGTIDRVLESSINEKTDSQDLVLDGKLAEGYEEDVDFAKLLKVAQEEFTTAGTLDEADLEKQWPALQDKLRKAWASTKGL